jgi:vacuolar-type H+-ATPase subunit E/Vma4
MGVEEIVQLIEREAAEEAVRLVADADARAATLLEEAEVAARAQVAAACERGEPAIRAEAMRRVNAARLRLLEHRAIAAARRIDAVITTADERLRAIAEGADRRRWAAALERLAIEALEAIGPGAIVRVRVADAPLVAGTVAAGGGRLEPLDGPGVPPGLQATDPAMRIEVDATLAARLGRARTRLAEDMGRALDLGA